MTASLLGCIDWELRRDKEKGHRDYSIIWLLKTTHPDDGPAMVMAAADLPVIGSYWQFGNDVDQWAFCSPELTIQPVYSKEPGVYWTAEQVFTTRPFFRCQDTTYENPLNEPFRISGTFNPEKLEMYYGRSGKPYMNSSGEPITGKAVEFDASKPTVKIGMNIPDLPLSFATVMMHHINDSPLWGCPAKCVKFSNFTFNRQIYGSCFFYYSIDMDFDIDFNTFDRKAYDSGTMYLKTGGNPDNPKDYLVYQDGRGNTPKRVFLDGSGGVLEDKNSPVELPIEHYPLGNLLTLGIPAAL